MSTHTEELVADVLISAVLILDSKGHRIVAKYYPNPNLSMKPTLPLADQLKLEQSLTTAADRSSYRGEFDICAVESSIAIFTQHEDVRVFVVVDQNESETVASMVLTTISQNLQYLFDFRVSKINILNSIDLVMFLLDEVVDNGYILELDVDAVMKRVAMRDDEDESSAKKFQQTDISLSTAISRAFGW